MGILYYFQDIRNDFLNAFFLLFTKLGEETVFLVLALIMLWCVDKRRGYFVLISNFFGIIINQTLKLICKVPRPWVDNTSFDALEGAKEAASGYSFPSGHSQNAVGTFGAIAVGAKHGWVKVVCIIIAVLVPISRLYLGVHTPWDVMAGAGIALLLVLVFDYFFSNDEKFEKFMPYMLIAASVAAVGFFLYAVIFSGGDDENAKSAAENACTLLGCVLGLIPAYFIDRRYIRFETKAPWYIQIVKLVLGLGGVIAIKAGLKPLLSPLLGAEYERIVRYFIMVAFAGTVWPLTFKKLSSLHVAKLDDIGRQFAYVLSSEEKVVRKVVTPAKDAKGKKASRRRGKARKNSNYSNKG